MQNKTYNTVSGGKTASDMKRRVVCFFKRLERGTCQGNGTFLNYEGHIYCGSCAGEIGLWSV